MRQGVSPADEDRFERRRAVVPDPLLPEEERAALMAGQARQVPLSLDVIVVAVVGSLKVSLKELESPSRRRRVAKARALIAWYATREADIARRDVAARLKRHPSSLSVAMYRYSEIDTALFEKPLSEC